MPGCGSSISTIVFARYRGATRRTSARHRRGSVEIVGLLGWIVVGFVAGAFARAVTGGGWNLGCLGTIVVGVLGGPIGGMLFNAAGDEGIGDFGLRSMFVAFVGAVVLLVIVGLVTGRSRSPRRR
jgi:uncharacterized membrane protein YeaQ/YmgE (transglycosylase-associated protein family)